jgi:hypothetical protein
VGEWGLIGREWLASHLGYFTPGERAPLTHWMGEWVGINPRNSPPHNAYVKNGWSWISNPPYAFLACTETIYRIPINCLIRLTTLDARLFNRFFCSRKRILISYFCNYTGSWASVIKTNILMKICTLVLHIVLTVIRFTIWIQILNEIKWLWIYNNLFFDTSVKCTGSFWISFTTGFFVV